MGCAASLRMASSLPDQTKSGLVWFMGKIINIQAAKTHLSRLVEEAAAGEEIIIAKAGKPMVKVIPYQAAKKTRVGGQLKGQIWQSADCWESDKEMIRLFNDGPIYPQDHGPDSDQHVAEESK